jgi:signal transduction histidine kinase
MGHEYAGVIGGSAAGHDRRRLRGRRRAVAVRPSEWGSRVRSLAGLNTLDLRVLALLGIALAAARAEQVHGTVGGGPHDVALILRAAAIGGLIIGGIAIQLSPDRRRIGRLLLVAAIIASLPLLHAPQHSVALAIGLLSLSLTPAAFSFLMLASPSGRIDSRLERSFIGAGAGAALLLGLAASITPDQTVLSWLIRGTAVVIAGGTAVLMVRRVSHGNPRARALHAPMATIAVLYAAAVVADVAARALGATEPARDAHEIADVAVALAIPIAITLSLAVERMSLGRALASFVSSLGEEPASNVQAAIAATLNDPQLRIYYRRDGTGEFLDPAGRRQPPTETPARRRTAIEGGGGPLPGVIDYDADLYGQEEFLRAAGTTALLWIEQKRLVADLEAAKSNLEASQLRLSHTAEEERERIQRDLHDGAQQHLIGMHIKVDRALESLETDPARCAGLLAELGEEMGETARDLRSLATKVFPATLKEYGLVDALASAIRTMGLAVHLETHSVGRHPPDVEMEVYFACLEGLQNIGKHCGPDGVGTLRVWSVRRWLFFELRDTGPGFDRNAVGDGLGLENMHDRLSSIGGRLSIVSHPGDGTVLKGVVPARPANGRLR